MRMHTHASGSGSGSGANIKRGEGKSPTAAVQRCCYLPRSSLVIGKGGELSVTMRRGEMGRGVHGWSRPLHARHLSLCESGWRHAGRERATGGERWGGIKRRASTHTQTRAAHVCKHAQAESRGDHFSHPPLAHTLRQIPRKGNAPGLHTPHTPGMCVCVCVSGRARVCVGGKKGRGEVLVRAGNGLPYKT